MENSNLLILILSTASVVYILFKVGQKIVKGILVLIIAGLAFYFWQGGTVDELKGKGIQSLIDQSSLVNLRQNNCAGDKADNTKCLCIIGPVEEDLRSRLSSSEMRTLDLDAQLRKKEIRSSMSNKQKEIRQCIINKKGPEYWNGMKGIWERLKDATEKIEKDSPV